MDMDLILRLIEMSTNSMNKKFRLDLDISHL